MARRSWVVAALLVVGCGGGGGSGSEVSVPLHGNVSFGVPVAGVTVSVFALDGSKALIAGPTMTDAFGNVTFSGMFAASAPLAVTTSAGMISFAGAQIAVPAMTTFVPGGAGQFAVTPLSVAVVRRTAMLIGKSSDVDLLTDALERTGAGVAQQFGLHDVVTLIPADPTKAGVMAVPKPGGVEYIAYDLEGRQYGLVLAGFLNLAAALSVTPQNLLDAFLEDVADGTLDGLAGTTPIMVMTLANTSTTILPTTFTAELQKAISAFAASPLNTTNIPSVTIGPSAVPIATGAMSILSVNPACNQGTSFSDALKVRGGTPSYTWAANGLPPGVELDPNSGVLSGACPPCAVECTSPAFTITVTDSSAPTNQATVPLMIISTVSPPMITSVASPTVQTNQLVNVPLITGVTGGVPPYSYILGTFAGYGLISDLTVDVTNGNLIGKATRHGSFTFQVSVVDSIGHEAFSDVTVQVTGEDSSSGSGGFDGTYSGSASACGSSNPISLSVSGGTVSGTVGSVAFSGTVDAGGGAHWAVAAGTETDTFTGTFTADGHGMGTVSVAAKVPCSGTWSVSK